MDLLDTKDAMVRAGPRADPDTLADQVNRASGDCLVLPDLRETQETEARKVPKAREALLDPGDLKVCMCVCVCVCVCVYFFC